MIKKITIVISILFLVFVIGTTIYSITIYQYNLPKIETSFPTSEAFSYNFKKTAAAEKNIDESLDFTYITKVEIEFDMNSLEYFYIYIDDLVNISKIGSRELEVEGRILDILISDKIILIIGFNGNYFNEDDTININIMKKTSVFDTVIQNEGVFNDQNGLGEYIYLIEVIDGAWGEEYILKRTYINIIAKTDINTSILENISSPYMIKSDKEVFDNDIVRFYP